MTIVAPATPPSPEPDAARPVVDGAECVVVVVVDAGGAAVVDGAAAVVGVVETGTDVLDACTCA
jgi:hypothetical protein